MSTYTENFQHTNNVEYRYCRKRISSTQGPEANYQVDQQKFPRRKQTGTHKKKEERFNPSGQVSMRQKRAGTAIVPRSNVHKHTVTLGESMDHKDYRREDWDQPGLLQLGFIQWIAAIYYKLLPSNGLEKIEVSPTNLITYNGLLLPTAIEIHLMDNKNCCCISNLLPDNVLVEKGGF